VTISSNFLSGLLETDAIALYCDERYQPCGLSKTFVYFAWFAVDSGTRGTRPSEIYSGSFSICSPVIGCAPLPISERIFLMSSAVTGLAWLPHELRI
jgi:hypothetical protein